MEIQEIDLHNQFKSLEAKIDSLSLRPTPSPRFDWKTFWTTTAPILVLLITTITVSYFGIKTSLEVVKNDVSRIKVDIAKIEKSVNSDIAKIEKSINSIDERVRNTEIAQAKFSGSKTQ